MIRSRLAQRFVLSPNIEPRRNNRPIDMLVLHYTGMASAEAACRQLCDPVSGVSCHYLIDEHGVITQMVGEEMRAWHAGTSMWAGEADTNSRAIGIEIHNPGHWLGYEDFPDVQMRPVIALCRDILSRHEITPAHVLAHSDVAPGRKIDPGERFDWRRLYGAGIGHWVPPQALSDAEPLSPASLRSFQQLLGNYGYGLEITGILDESTRRATDAFQRHFRQARVDGIPDVSALLTLEKLIAGLSR